MMRSTIAVAVRSALCVALLAMVHGDPARAQNAEANKATPDAYDWNNRAPDPRFKADILVVVAHPDDEIMVAAYLAREIYDQNKRVAVVFQNPGDGGNNDVGPEQAAALGTIRQIEGRNAVGSLGITNVWFLNGHDTANQNVLTSLEHCGHGGCLDQLVRIVRITRPSVILTWLPDFTTGENHADHQAAGVLATEAFDLAGDPTVFSEQVSPAIHPNVAMNMTEALRPWQPEKIYYVYNPTHDIFEGQGPQYSSHDVSPSQHQSYGMLAAKEVSHHVTQGGGEVTKAIADGTAETNPHELTKFAMQPVKFIFGKSLVPSGVTDDVFTGVTAEGVSFQRAPGYTAPKYSEPTLMIGDPWAFYQRLWQAHGIEHLKSLVPLEITIHTDGVLYIPLIIENPYDHAIDVKLSAQAPDGWKVRQLDPLSVPAHAEYFARVTADAPSTKLPGWQPFTVTADSAGKSLGTVPIRVELSSGWVASQ